MGRKKAEDNGLRVSMGILVCRATRVMQASLKTSYTVPYFDMFNDKINFIKRKVL